MLFVPQHAAAAHNGNFRATLVTTAMGTTVASGAAYTKGSYASLVASTSYEWRGFWLFIGGSGASATRRDGVLDIALGAGGSEQVIVSNLLVGWRPTLTAGGMQLFLPIRVPKGVQVSARWACATASINLDVGIHGVAGQSNLGGPLYSGCDSHAVTYTAGSVASGQSHTPGNTNAYSTYANLGGTTSRGYQAALLIPQGTMATTTMTAIAYQWRLGIGGTTIAEWFNINQTTELVQGPWPGMPIPCSIPSGAQLQVQAKASGTAQAMDVGAFLFY